MSDSDFESTGHSWNGCHDPYWNNFKTVVISDCKMRSTEITITTIRYSWPSSYLTCDQLSLTGELHWSWWRTETVGNPASTSHGRSCHCSVPGSSSSGGGSGPPGWEHHGTSEVAMVLMVMVIVLLVILILIKISVSWWVDRLLLGTEGVIRFFGLESLVLLVAIN